MRFLVALLLLCSAVTTSVAVYAAQNTPKVHATSSSTTAISLSLPSALTVVLPESVQQDSPQPKPAQPVVASTPVRQQPVAPRPSLPASDTITIHSIGLSSRITPVGKTAANAIDVHPSLVGWYDRSAAFGTPGAAFLDGHRPGVFTALPKVTIGSIITIQTSAGQILTYTVAFTEAVPLENIDMRKALRPYEGATEGLNLMTRVGTYSPTTGTTDQRFIVYAVRS